MGIHEYFEEVFRDKIISGDLRPEYSNTNYYLLDSKGTLKKVNWSPNWRTERKYVVLISEKPTWELNLVTEIKNT
jgi:hypothetical protein